MAERRTRLVDDDAGGPGNTRRNPGFETDIRRHFLSVEHGLTDSLSARLEGSTLAIEAERPDGSLRVDGIGDTTILFRHTFTARSHEHREGEPPGPLGLHLGEGRVSLGLGLVTLEPQVRLGVGLTVRF